MLTPAVSHSSHKPGDDYDEARFVHHLSGLYLERPVARGEAVDFRRHGARQASLAAMVWLLEAKGWFPMAALRETVLALPGQKARDTLLAVLPPEAH